MVRRGNRVRLLPRRYHPKGETALELRGGETIRLRREVMAWFLRHRRMAALRCPRTGRWVGWGGQLASGALNVDLCAQQFSLPLFPGTAR